MLERGSSVPYRASPLARLKSVIAAQRDMVSAGPNLDRVIEITAERALELTTASAAALALCVDDELVYRAATGSARHLLGLRQPVASGLGASSLLDRGVIACADAESDLRVDAGLMRQMGARSVVAVPLFDRQTPLGLLYVLGAEPSYFDDDDVGTLELMSGFIAAAISNALIQQAAAIELVKPARADRLTGVLHRRAGEEVIAQELERAVRYQRALSFIMIDVDELKLVNDREGADAGDSALRDIGSLIASRLRRTDAAIRWAEDEFLIVVPETALLGAQDLAESLRALVEQEQAAGRGLTISAGVASRRQSERAEQTIARADERLRVAKRNGRNRVEL